MSCNRPPMMKEMEPWAYFWGAVVALGTFIAIVTILIGIIGQNLGYVAGGMFALLLTLIVYGIGYAFYVIEHPLEWTDDEVTTQHDQQGE